MWSKLQTEPLPAINPSVETEQVSVACSVNCPSTGNSTLVARNSVMLQGVSVAQVIPSEAECTSSHSENVCDPT